MPQMRSVSWSFEVTMITGISFVSGSDASLRVAAIVLETRAGPDETASMPNAEGTPIWYELLTNDVAASKVFYEGVLGWNVQPPQPGDAKGYRMIDTGNGFVGG